MTQAPEAILAGKQRPFTGAEFLASLRDGREVYIYGERVEDVTTHPALRNAAVSVAKLYDALHDAKTKGVLTAADRHGLGRLHAQVLQGRPLAPGRDRPARRDRRLGAHHLRLDGPQPDYKAAFLNTLGANADFYGKFADNARAWHKRGRRPCSTSTTRSSIRPSIAPSPSSR
jgi:4-hydroxyphenylacetate 3-monooxygenase